MKKIVVIFMLFLFISNSKAQSNVDYLREYIKLGLEQNLDLQSSKEILNTYDAKVSQATSNFLPKVDVNARYTKAGGGRSFIFPLGTMLNPIYEALNFPIRLTDEPVNFVRPKEHDTKVELIQPIFNWAILQGYRAQNNMFRSASYEYNAKTFTTIFSIKEAYYNYAKTVMLVEVQTSGLNLAKENLDVTKKLYAVDKSPKSDVSRAEVLFASSQQALYNANNMLTLAKGSFNNILNRELEVEINFITLDFSELEKFENSDDLSTKFSLEDSYKMAISNRPELKQMHYALRSVENVKSLNYNDFLPNLTFVADYGFQGEEYKFNKESEYWMLSAVLSWNLFSGFGSKAKLEEAQAQINSIQRNEERVKNLILLEVKNNYISLKSLKEELSVARKRVLSAEESYTDVKKSYDVGMVPLIQLIDAQTAFDAARANYVVTFYSTLTQKANFEKSIGLIESY
jgi:outer membrane protein TolC